MTTSSYMALNIVRQLSGDSDMFSRLTLLLCLAFALFSISEAKSLLKRYHWRSGRNLWSNELKSYKVPMNVVYVSPMICMSSMMPYLYYEHELLVIAVISLQLHFRSGLGSFAWTRLK